VAATVEDAIAERIRRGELVAGGEHEAAERQWAVSIAQSEQTVERVVAANEGLQERLRESQARVRELRERNRRLRARLSEHRTPED
jgi:predicted RNase H-like nuclease (RuvC/YqgF family)